MRFNNRNLKKTDELMKDTHLGEIGEKNTLGDATGILFAYLENTRDNPTPRRTGGI